MKMLVLMAVLCTVSNDNSELLFTDGSLVRGSVVTETLEVTTEYGKLSIPTKEVRAVYFGLHLSADSKSKFEKAIRELSSPKFMIRDTAQKRLVDPLAYPMLLTTDCKDMEANERVKNLLKEIKEKYSEEQLKFRESDVIVTRKFTIVGKIETEKLRLVTTNLGELDLQLQGMRAFQQVTPGVIGQVEMKAGKDWFDSGITLDGIGQVKFEASGAVDLWPTNAGQHMATAKGHETAGKKGPYFPGTLLGKIGDKVFMIGQSMTLPKGIEGRLYFRIEPSIWHNESSGGYQIKISQ